MPMTVPGVCRFTLFGHWTNGRQWASVLDFQIDSTGTAQSRAELISDQANSVVGDFQELVLPHLTNNVNVDGVNWIDLDDAEGSTGSRATNPGFPTAGGVAGASTTPNVSFLVHKQITGTRGTRRGRWYIPGVEEASVDENGGLSGSGVADLQSDLRAYLSAVNREEGLTSVSNLVVVHLEERPPPDEEDNRVGTFTFVDDLFLDPMVATQRRRLR